MIFSKALESPVISALLPRVLCRGLHYLIYAVPDHPPPSLPSVIARKVRDPLVCKRAGSLALAVDGARKPLT